MLPAFSYSHDKRTRPHGTMPYPRVDWRNHPSGAVAEHVKRQRQQELSARQSRRRKWAEERVWF